MKVFLNANPRHCEETNATRQTRAAREASGLLRFARNDGAGDENTKKNGPEPAFSCVEKTIRE